MPPDKRFVTRDTASANARSATAWVAANEARPPKGDGALRPAMRTSQGARHAESAPPKAGASAWAMEAEAVPPDLQGTPTVCDPVDDGVLDPRVDRRSVLRDSHFGKTGAKLCGSLKLLGHEAGAAELPGYGGNLFSLRGNSVDEEDGDDGPIHDWWRGLQHEEWLGWTAAGAA